MVLQNTSTLGAFLVLVPASPSSIGVPWSSLSQTLLTEDSEGDWHILGFSNNHSRHFPKLWSLNSFLWAGSGDGCLLTQLRFRSLSSLDSDSLWCSPAKLFCMNAPWKTLPSWNTCPGVFKLLSWLSHKKEWNNAIFSNMMDLEIIILSEVSQRQTLPNITYM